MKTRVFKSGNSLAVRIPKEFAISTDEMFITRIGTSLILRETTARGEALRTGIELFTDDFMDEGRMQPVLPESSSIDLAADEAVRYEVDPNPSYKDSAN
jgi:antitoxin VapB